MHNNETEKTSLKCSKDDHAAITEFCKKNGVNFDSAAHNINSNKKLRCWKEDHKIAKDFCEKYDFCYGEFVENEIKYNIFFSDVDGDEIECCLSKNSGDLSGEPLVKYSDIVLYIPLNERDLKTDLHAELLKYCLANNFIHHS